MIDFMVKFDFVECSENVLACSVDLVGAGRSCAGYLL